MSSMDSLDFAQKVIRYVWAEFIDHFDAATNVDRLYSGELLDDSMMEVVLSAKSKKDANRAFFTHLRSNATIESLDKLCKLLRDTARDHPRHDRLAKLLEDKLKQWKVPLSSHVPAQRGAKGVISRPSSPQSATSELTETVLSEEDAASRLGIAALDLSKRTSQPKYTDALLAEDPPDRKLHFEFFRLLSRLAKLFNKHIDDLKPFLRNRQKSEEWPYKLLEIEDINAASNVHSIFTKICIENCWLNTEILFRLINVLPDKKLCDKAMQDLEAYHKLLEVFSKYVLLSHIPDDDARLEHFRSRMFPKQMVTYDVNIEDFDVSMLLKQQKFLSTIFQIPEEAFHYLEAKPGSTLITWALAISIEEAFEIFQKVAHEFWSLKEHSIIKVEIEAVCVFQLHLRGNNLPYLIKKALQRNQKFLACTEHLSHQFLALVDYSHPKMKDSEPSLKQSSGPLNVVESETQEQVCPGDVPDHADERDVEIPLRPPSHEGFPSPVVGSETTTNTFGPFEYSIQTLPQQGEQKPLQKLLGQDDDDDGSYSGSIAGIASSASSMGAASIGQRSTNSAQRERTGISSHAPRTGMYSSGQGGKAKEPISSWLEKVHSTPAKKQDHKQDHIQNEDAEKPVNDTSEYLRASKKPEGHRSKPDSFSQDKKADEMIIPEDYVPPMNLGVPSHHLYEAEPDPSSILHKGTKPSAVLSSGQKVHPSNVCLVCIACLDALNDKVLSLKSHCKDPNAHPLVTMTKGFQCPQMLTQIRPSHRSEGHKNLAMCHDPLNCTFEDICANPHSQEELHAWTGKTPTGEVCLPCRWDRILQSGLLERMCLTGKHPPDALRVAILDVVQSDFLHLHMPPPNCVNWFEHRVADCPLGTNWSQCQYPHSELEFRVWTSLQGFPFYSKAYFHEQVLTAAKTVGIVATDRFLTLKRNHLFEQEAKIVSHSLDVSNYVARFQALLDLEEVVHWEKLRKYNKMYHCEWSDEYLYLKMDETSADIVYQSASEATVFFANNEMTGNLCGVDKDSCETKSYLCVNISSYVLSHLRAAAPTNVQVTFHLKEWYFRKLYQAVGDLPDHILHRLVPMKPALFPQYSVTMRGTDLAQGSGQYPEQIVLDDENKQTAFERILSLSDSPAAPYLIVGPFGTGKTRLIMATAWRLLKDAPQQHKILIATHHIRTANSYAEMCNELQQQNQGRFNIVVVRLVSGNWNYQKHQNVSYAKTISEALKDNLLFKCNLIITTFIVSQKFSQVANKIGQFSHIFIDEGAQAREPENVAAFACAGKGTKIVIAGDHMQVSPGSQVLGAKPLKYGLGTSLLARLHDSYRKNKNIKRAAKLYQSVLLSNYRCHSSILRLPGGLFYESSLQACNKQELHPDMKNPLTFVCTSLDLVPECFIPGYEIVARDCEISTLYNWVLKCAESWPTVEWGRRNMSALCVILPSRQMLRLWREHVAERKGEQHVNMSQVAATVSWDIQGREYKAVFLCTSEPADKNYSPEESTKSICEPTVFNTVVTRAQSLVVACGNPFRILTVESNTKGSKGCWMEFFHRCMENKALLLSESIAGDRTKHERALQILEAKMFERASVDIVGLPEITSDTGDSIIRSYSEEFNQKNAPLALGKVRYDSGWKIWEKLEGEELLVPDTSKHHVHYVEEKNAVECRLWQTMNGACEAVPVSRREQKFTIRAEDRRCAFEGARVKVVELWKRSETSQRFGRVCTVLEQGSIQPVLCEADSKNVIVFHSVDGRAPRFSNLPHITKRHLEEMSSDALCKFLNRPTKYVTCFDPRSLKKGTVPKISDSVPLEMANNLLFLVQPLYWSAKHRYPIGAVVGSFPKGTSIAHATKILAIQYQVGKASPTGTVPTQPKKLLTDVNHAIGIRDHNDLCQVAFSVAKTQSGKGHEISIHVTDVTGFITDNSKEFEESVRQRAFIGTELDYKQVELKEDVPVLSKEVLKQASFSDDTVEPAVASFTISFVISEAGSIPGPAGLNYSVCTNKNVSCKVILNFVDLEVIIHNVAPEAQTQSLDESILAKLRKHDCDSNFSLLKKIQLLFKVAQSLHYHRKGHNNYSNLLTHSYSYPNAGKLVNELLVLTGTAAAKTIARSFPKCTLLKVQQPLSMPSEKELVGSLAHLSPFASFQNQLSFSKNRDKSLQLPFPRKLCNELLSVLEAKPPDLLRVRQLLSLPIHNAHLLVLEAAIRDHTPREEYAVRKVINKSSKDVNSKVVAFDQPTEVDQHLTHYSLNSVCSPITSPFESTFDIHTQKLLKLAGCNKVGMSFDELNEMARKCNMATANANSYSVALSSLSLAVSAISSSICVEAVIKTIADGKLHLGYLCPGLDLKSLADINLSLLTGSSKVLTTKKIIKVTSVTGPLRMLLHSSYVKVEDKSNQLLVYSPSQVSKNLTQNLIFIDYLPEYASLTVDQWAPVNEFLENCSQISAEKLSTFLKYVRSTHFTGRYPSLTLSRTSEDLNRDETSVLTASHQDSAPWLMPNAPFVILKASFEFKPLQTLKMWIRADMTEYVATPKPQVLELSPDVRICLQHLSEPEACFTKGVVAESAKLQYSTINQYCRVWKDLVLAEAAVSSIKGTSSQALQFTDFKLRFSDFEVPPDCIREEVYEPSGVISSILTKEFMKSCQDIFPFEPGDFVCAKYEVSLAKARQLVHGLADDSSCLHPVNMDKRARFVLHMIVEEVVKMEDDADSEESEVMMAEDAVPVYCNVKVKFKIANIAKNRVSPLVKSLLASNKFTCELQVIPVFLPLRRVYNTLRRFPELPSESLPHLIARGDVNELSRLQVSKEELKEVTAELKKHDRVNQIWTGSLTDRLNDSQILAIKCSLRNKFQLIQGPPGTGKSITGAHVAYAFAMKNRLRRHSAPSKEEKAECVLYCAPTNVAVDVVFKTLAAVSDPKDMYSKEKLRILRIYGRGIEKQAFPGPFSNTEVFSSHQSKYKLPGGFEDSILHHLIHNASCPYSKDLEKLEARFQQCRESKEIPSSDDRIRYRTILATAERDMITRGAYDVVLCTCNESAGSRIRTHLSPLQCIVDEASMVTEPESMAPISISQQVVLIGDHKQLQPVVQSDVAKRNGMNVSLFERYATLSKNSEHASYKYPWFVRLDVQYRMLRPICQFPKEHFYRNQLTTKVFYNSPKRIALEDFWPRGRPLVLCDVVGREETENEEPMVGSKKNQTEAEKIVEITESMGLFMTATHLKKCKITVGVLTFYRAQKVLIEKLLKEHNLQKCVSVKTVDASQGSEYDYVILSAVRSKSLETLSNEKKVHTDRHWRSENLGFVTDPHRLCVALTRARFGLVIVGNIELLRSDELWEQLIITYEQNGNTCKEHEFPTGFVKKRIESSKSTKVSSSYFFKQSAESDPVEVEFGPPVTIPWGKDLPEKVLGKEKLDLFFARHEAWSGALKELPQAARKLASDQEQKPAEEP